MTTKELTIVIPMGKPRNPFHEDLKRRKAGSHRLARKAKRQKDKQNMLRHMDALLKESKTEFDID